MCALVQNKYQGVGMALLVTNLDKKNFWTRATYIFLLPPNSTPLPWPCVFPFHTALQLQGKMAGIP